jgi:copper homeostasis protein CutC
MTSQPNGSGSKSSRGRVLLELCVGGIDDVEIATRNEVDRIELNSGMAVGGLTPSYALARNSRQLFRGPIISMIRPHEGGFCYSKSEFLMMLNDAEHLLPMGIEGLAVGFLTADGQIDLDRCKRLRALLPTAQLVFHRAFDVVADRITAITQLIDCGFDRILTSGGAATAELGCASLKVLIQIAGNRIEILPGGGIRASNVASIVRQTGCRQVHSAAREVAVDPSIASHSDVHYGLPNEPNGSFGRVSESALNDLQAAISNLP